MLYKLLLVLLLVLTIAVVGCTPVEPPSPPVESGIVCEGGYYSVHYGEWSLSGCEGTYIEAGTFWRNKDGRIFLLGDPVNIKEVIKIFGDCPTSYIKEIEIKK